MFYIHFLLYLKSKIEMTCCIKMIFIGKNNNKEMIKHPIFTYSAGSDTRFIQRKLNCLVLSGLLYTRNRALRAWF